jgi:hypothetical protein
MFPLSKRSILNYSSSYDINYSEKEAKIENVLKRKIRGQQFLTREDYLAIGMWKSPRPKKHYENNTDDFIREVSSISFNTLDEKLRIEILTLLNGCKYPLASAILHFKYPNKYPIIDYRVLWSFKGINRPISYNFDRWSEYVEDIRRIASRYKVDIRTIDKALWKYSEENQSESPRVYRRLYNLRG